MVTLVRVTRRAAGRLADDLGVAAIALTGPLCVQIAFYHGRAPTEQFVQYDSHFSFAIKRMMGSVLTTIQESLSELCCARRFDALQARIENLEASQLHAQSLGLSACCLNPGRAHVR